MATIKDETVTKMIPMEGLEPPSFGKVNPDLVIEPKVDRTVIDPKTIDLDVPSAVYGVLDVTRVTSDPMGLHLNYVREIASEDAEGLIKGDPKYGYSWKKRGGVGAYMMATRKFDRLDNSLQPVDDVSGDGYVARLGKWLSRDIRPFDIFAALENDTRSEGVIDDIRDLRRYLLLIEAEMRSRNVIHGVHRDNKAE
ncbi:MAG: hypothetical protein JWN75_1227 [Candidatus Saccharibacteria bacterium]|nr:hypothetical protein [Candidatus Saccharibacteria bacterium]MDB5716424.1 hypothetical protein [Sphingomonadales bacterium]